MKPAQPAIKGNQRLINTNNKNKAGYFWGGRLTSQVGFDFGLKCLDSTIFSCSCILWTKLVGDLENKHWNIHQAATW